MIAVPLPRLPASTVRPADARFESAISAAAIASSNARQTLKADLAFAVRHARRRLGFPVFVRGSFLEFIGRRLARFLSQPIKGYKPTTTCDPDCLARALVPGDVLLVEGKTRISTAIKYLTQSTWSHAALYVGPISGRSEPNGEAHVLVEAEIDGGVISSPLSKYLAAHTRICRPVGLAGTEIDAVIAFAVARIGHSYDLKNIIDLARYLLPTPPVPVRFRRRMIALGSGAPTRAICSTLIAQAFQSIRYPILPEIESLPNDVSRMQSEQIRTEILHIRHYSLFTPHDFDVSPYFAIVKPTLEAGFDHRLLTWAADTSSPPQVR